MLIVSFFFLFFFSISFSFSLSHFSIFFNVKDGTTPLFVAVENEYEQIVQILLEKGANVDFAKKVILLIVSFSFFFFFQFLIFLFFFSLSHFSIFFYVKNGVTPLFVAAQKGKEQIVQLLLEKGEPNVDLATEVILLIVSFFFLFFFNFFFCFTFSFFYFF